MDKDDRRAIREALELALGIIEGHQNAEAARPSIDEALAILDKSESVADGLECGWCGKSLDKEEVKCPECGKYGYIQASVPQRPRPVADGAREDKARELTEKLRSLIGGGVDGPAWDSTFDHFSALISTALAASGSGEAKWHDCSNCAHGPNSICPVKINCGPLLYPSWEARPTNPFCGGCVDETNLYPRVCDNCWNGSEYRARTKGDAE